MTTGSRQLLHRVTLVRVPASTAASLPNLSILSVYTPLEKRVYEPLRRLTCWVWSTLFSPLLFSFLANRPNVQSASVDRPCSRSRGRKRSETMSKRISRESLLVMPKAASSLMNDEEVNEPRQSMSINLLLLLAIVTTIRPLSRNWHLVRGGGRD